METKTIKGIIYSMSKDNKSVSILGEWFRSFTTLSFKKGDVVFIEYYTKTKDGKTFNNIKTIKNIEEEKEPDWAKDIDSSYEEPNLNKVSIPNQTQNTILMKVSDIIIKEIETGYKYEPTELSIKIKKLTNDFKEAFLLLS